jgi:hypothetical protein
MGIFDLISDINSADDSNENQSALEMEFNELLQEYDELMKENEEIENMPV